ncbi:Putative peptidoglycan binding domain-containing protein [Austwickia chelonae]|uniref:Peptidoglycan binding-like domain-containing protein n=1 Tax=Austwickia chelonae NBRC 105200 TaxID=1184607 RepID=K6VNL5_9MICO|nr:peptidoglycan-binding domain-containing protein [Austwickia chelonae]GAB78334.1 hypothetical protein AUCHE_08_05810 [Austwickia chelonae NBRC 105200]SEW01516.1 Putative peptidoglycan binding domain-containing protein [Austwickia chelonae]
MDGTSGATGFVHDICPNGPHTGHPSLVLGTKGAHVAEAQRLLGVGETGVFDYETWVAVQRWQERGGVDITGVLDQHSWALLDPGRVC